MSDRPPFDYEGEKEEMGVKQLPLEATASVSDPKGVGMMMETMREGKTDREKVDALREGMDHLTRLGFLETYAPNELVSFLQRNIGEGGQLPENLKPIIQVMAELVSGIYRSSYDRTTGFAHEHAKRESIVRSAQRRINNGRLPDFALVLFDVDGLHSLNRRYSRGEADIGFAKLSKTIINNVNLLTAGIPGIEVHGFRREATGDEIVVVIIGLSQGGFIRNMGDEVSMSATVSFAHSREITSLNKYDKERFAAVFEAVLALAERKNNLEKERRKVKRDG